MNKKLLMSLAIFSSTFVANELANANEAEANTKKATTYKLTGNVKTYTNAANAQAGVKAAKKTYTAGNYYVYKTASNGMINISTQQGKPGAWINPNGQVKAQVPAQQTKTTTANTAATKQKAATPTPAPKTTKTSANTTAKPATYVLNSSAKTYTNAANAASGVNAKSTYGAGNYYIYRTANNGMLNISRTAGKVGAWINPSTNVAAPKATTASKPAPKAAPKTNTSVKATETKSTPKQTPAKQEAPKTFKLTNAMQTYTNAANAAAGVNGKSTYAAGTYYVYKTTSNGMINISRTPGKVGAWINPNAKPSAAKSTKTQTATTPKQAEKKPSNTSTKSVIKQKSGVRTDYGNYSKIIYLDAGHGGADPGAVKNGLREKDLNLSIYNKLSSRLKKEGYTIMSTRNGDTQTTLTQISEKANKTDADIFISIHFNSSASTSARGIETYWYQDYAEYPSRINKDNHTNPDRLRRSQILANGIHSNMVKNTGAADRGVRRDTYSVLRETALPSVLLELGYMSNKDEAKWIAKSSYQDSLVDGIVKGINNYYAKA